MLILTRKKDESIIIDGHIEIQIISIEEGKVRIGINAPKEIQIHRSEVFDKILESNKEAAQAPSAFKVLSERMKKTEK